MNNLTDFLHSNLCFARIACYMLQTYMNIVSNYTLDIFLPKLVQGFCCTLQLCFSVKMIHNVLCCLNGLFGFYCSTTENFRPHFKPLESYSVLWAYLHNCLCVNVYGHTFSSNQFFRFFLSQMCYHKHKTVSKYSMTSVLRWTDKIFKQFFKDVCCYLKIYDNVNHIIDANHES